MESSRVGELLPNKRGTKAAAAVALAPLATSPTLPAWILVPDSVEEDALFLQVGDEQEEEAAPGGLSVKDANWFLDALEGYNESRLQPEELSVLHASRLRSKIKHRASILFFEDTRFILETEHAFALDWTDAMCQRDPKRWIIHQLCKVVVANYRHSIANKADRSCIWSALMDRALYHLQRSGFTNVSIETRRGATREATLFVGDYHISRSNFTKVFKRYC